MTRHLPMSIRPSGLGPGQSPRLGTRGARRQRRAVPIPTSLLRTDRSEKVPDQQVPGRSYGSLQRQSGDQRSGTGGRSQLRPDRESAKATRPGKRRLNGSDHRPIDALRTRGVRTPKPVESYVLARMGRPTCPLHPYLGMRSPSASSAARSQARLSNPIELGRMHRLRGALDRHCWPMLEMRSCGHTVTKGHLRASDDACGVGGGIPRSLPFERTDHQCLLAAGDRCRFSDATPW